MKKILKWAGIVLGGLFLLFLIAVPFFMGTFFHGRAPMMGGFRAPHSFGMLWFAMGLMSFGRLLFPLLIAGLLVWGGYVLGRNAGRRESAAPVVPAAPIVPAAPVVEEQPIIPVPPQSPQ
jgi:hypothetical protein